MQLLHASLPWERFAVGTLGTATLRAEALPKVMAAFWPLLRNSGSKTSTNGAHISAVIPQESREPWWKHPGKNQDNGATTFLRGITPGKTFK